MLSYEMLAVRIIGRGYGVSGFRQMKLGFEIEIVAVEKEGEGMEGC